MEALRVVFKASFPLEETMRVIEARKSFFRTVNGLVQKYYLHDRETGVVAGFHLFDTVESLDGFLKSVDFPKSVQTAYETAELPTMLRSQVPTALYDTQK